MFPQITLVSMALILGGCASRPPLLNLAVVDSRQNILRGGQPTVPGWATLAQRGITNVVKLNPAEEGSDQAAMDLGMIVRRFPISTFQQFGLEKIPTLDLRDAVAAIRAGTYIHCTHGQDRTGVIVALWRVRCCGWTKANAEAEMMAHGFHKELRGLWEVWEDSKP
ncbi:hypothetical protein D4Q85_00225 [bacterium]|nr:MAG: hypothetical protein D4Q85_00225 [bacterium]